MAGRKFKKYCYKLTCEGCTDMHYIAKAQRWCYDEVYGLSNAGEDRERLYIEGKLQRVMNGIIGHCTFGDVADNGSHVSWERNMTALIDIVL
jgi:hypothetical protein